MSLKQTDKEPRADLLPLDVQHADGTQNSLDRQRELAWLKNEDTESGRVCRALSNTRWSRHGRRSG